MDYIQIYKDFNNLLNQHSDRIVIQKMLVKDEYYIWEQSTSILLLRFVRHHSEYDILAKIIKMSVVETLVFCKLNEYREQANRERFLLPEGNKLDLFIDTIKECIKFVK